MVDREKVIKGLECCAFSKRGDKCEQCPYFSGCETEYGAFVELAHDALALLKTQEPRVMTLKEVKMLDSDYYYLESMRSPGKELREILGAYGLTCVTWPSITWARQTMGDSGYGKTWRCWTSRPDDATRKVEKWD